VILYVFTDTFVRIFLMVLRSVFEYPPRKPYLRYDLYCCMNENEKLDWKNNDRIFVPIYLSIVGISGLIIFLLTL